MAGLMPQGAAPAMPPADPTAPPADPSQAGGQGQQPTGKPPISDGAVDPATLEKMTANCMDVVTAGLKAILAMIQSTQDKAAALATASVHVLMQVEDSFEAAGGTLLLSMSFQAGAETLSDIADASEKAGAHDFSQQEIDTAFLRAVDQYRLERQKQGRIDQAAFKAALEQMKQAEANGTLEQEFPGLSEFAKKEQATDTKAPPAEGADPEAPAPDAEQPQDGTMPEAGGDFPPEMLKKESAPPQAKAKAKGKKGGK